MFHIGEFGQIYVFFEVFKHIDLNAKRYII